MIRSLVARRLVAVGSAVSVAAALSACSSSSNFADRSDYVSPIAVTAAPQPATPVMAGTPVGAHGRLPLLPPVPDDRETGLPPVTVAALLPPPVR